LRRFTLVMPARADMPVFNLTGSHGVWVWALTVPSLEIGPCLGKIWAVEALGMPCLRIHQ